MVEDSAQNSQETARARYSRAFRPLSCWLVISACLLARNYHQKHAPLTTVKFTVRIEGKTIGDSSVYAAEVGSQRVASGSVAPIGWHNFKVVVPDTNPFEKRVFIWYGENEVGDIGLEWNRGVLDLKIGCVVQFVGENERREGIKTPTAGGRELRLRSRPPAQFNSLTNLLDWPGRMSCLSRETGRTRKSEATRKAKVVG